MNTKYNIKNDKNVKISIYFNPDNSKESNLEDIEILLENDDKYEVYPTSEGSTSEGSTREDSTTGPNNSYKNVTNYIYRSVDKTEFLCRNINPDYILHLFTFQTPTIIRQI